MSQISMIKTTPKQAKREREERINKQTDRDRDGEEYFAIEFPLSFLFFLMMYVTPELGKKNKEMENEC